MKSFIFVLAFAFVQLTGFGQSKTTEFKVLGNCGMCEKRIEKALKVEGVESADWDKKTDMIKVKYNSDKISEIKLHELVAAAGHDTEKVKADEKSYNKLHGCCQYDRSEMKTKEHSEKNHKH